MVKSEISEIENGFGVKSPRSFKEILELTSSGRGEMIYASSFAHLFNLPDNKKKAIEICYKSLDTLSTKLASIANLRPLVLNIALSSLTILMAGYLFLNIVKIVKGSAAVSFGFAIFVVLSGMIIWWIGMRIYSWYSTRDHRST